MRATRWTTTDPLFRGDAAAGVGLPDPASRTGIVEHILYLGGHGRPTLFCSTTESPEIAEHFAGASGRVWETSVEAAVRESAKHLSHEQLRRDLKGYGRGKAKWHDAWQIAQAANYVEQWSEHLLDWTGCDPGLLSAAIGRAFRRSRR